jgi:hypothetical protein
MPIVRIAYPNPLPTEQADYVKQNALLEAGFLKENGAPFPVSGSNIVQGAVFQIGGTIYQADADTAITGVASDYVKLTPSLDGSTCAASFVADLTGVTWSKVYNGYYDVNGNLYVYNQFKFNLSGVLADTNTKDEKIADDINILIGNIYKYSSLAKGLVFGGASATTPVIAALTATRFVHSAAGAVSGTIQAYDFLNNKIQAIGSSFALSNLHAVCALSSTRIVTEHYVSGSGLSYLRTYDFNGSNWSQVGNSLAITPSDVVCRMIAMTGSTIAYYDSYNKTLRYYSFDGTNWSLIGSAYSISMGTNVNISMVAMSANSIAFIDQTNKELRTYTFNGSTWSLTGSGYSINSVGTSVLIRIGVCGPPSGSYTDIIHVNSENICNIIFRWNGSAWVVLYSIYPAIPSTTGITNLSVSDIITSSTAGILSVYEIIKSRTRDIE